jgi:hypothetical protein
LDDHIGIDGWWGNGKREWHNRYKYTYRCGKEIKRKKKMENE